MSLKKPLFFMCNSGIGLPGLCLNTERSCYTSDTPGCGSCCKKYFKDQDGKCIACPKGDTHDLFTKIILTHITGDFTLVYILILLMLVVAITVMQSFESPALVSSFKGLLTVMSFVQSFVSLRVRMFWNQNICLAA